ncbi:uncharacterized protein LOC107046743 [Diachasma alloeum]|uniref:uncharacterized protein LOC107046743 n=1 Tax=Diachasma alloeum TaxID=454923 RepID=UPI0007381B75|nr:uncharacterized protein LOC107046743 [Diachasma alloeum]
MSTHSKASCSFNESLVSPDLSPDIPIVNDSSQSMNLFSDYEMLTSSEYLQSISPLTTKLVEIVGIVHLVKGADTVKCKNGTVNTVCNFFVHNNDGETIQCVMWGETIDKFIDKLLVQHVIHIDGAFPKQVNDKFNSGTTPYELIIQSNTTITDLGKFKVPLSSQVDNPPEIVSLVEVANHKNIVVVRGFVKTPWAIIQKQTDSTGNTCYGSMASEKYFLDVKISDYPLDYVCPFTKGQHIECLGSIIRTGNSFFFCVQGPDCITLVDSEVASLKELLLCKPLMTINEERDATASSSKKMKKNLPLLQKFTKKN